MAAQDALLQDIAQVMRDQTSDLKYMFPGPVLSASISSKASSATTIRLLAPNPVRRGVILVNTDANDLYLRYGDTATTASNGWTYKISAGATWEMPQPIYAGRIDGIWTAAGAGVAEMTEL